LASTATAIREFYDALREYFGPQHWWPARSPFEVMVGAVLTQNTNWTNVEKAIANLRREGLLAPRALYDLPRERLAGLIRPAGYYNVKTARLSNLVAAIVEDSGGDLERFFEGSVWALRERLLAINGIGPETADSIILYAAKKPTFVIDAYTCRVAARHDLIYEPAAYDEVKALFEDSLPADAALFNEYHALLVQLGKRFCRKEARCEGCPLEGFPHSVEPQ
jgi:endonuclease III related protein